MKNKYDGPNKDEINNLIELINSSFESKPTAAELTETPKPTNNSTQPLNNVDQSPKLPMKSEFPNSEKLVTREGGAKPYIGNKTSRFTAQSRST